MEQTMRTTGSLMTLSMNAGPSHSLPLSGKKPCVSVMLCCVGIGCDWIAWWITGRSTPRNQSPRHSLANLDGLSEAEIAIIMAHDPDLSEGVSRVSSTPTNVLSTPPHQATILEADDKSDEVKFKRAKKGFVMDSKVGQYPYDIPFLIFCIIEPLVVVINIFICWMEGRSSNYIRAHTHVLCIGIPCRCTCAQGTCWTSFKVATILIVPARGGMLRVPFLTSPVLTRPGRNANTVNEDWQSAAHCFRLGSQIDKFNWPSCTDDLANHMILNYSIRFVHIFNLLYIFTIKLD